MSQVGFEYFLVGTYCRLKYSLPALGKLRVAELFFDVPVDYSKPGNGSLRLFARSVHRLETPVEPVKNDSNSKQLPWLVYLQGGPGFGCRAPQDYGWVGTVLDKGYQVWDTYQEWILALLYEFSHLNLVIGLIPGPTRHWPQLYCYCGHIGSTGKRNQASWIHETFPSRQHCPRLWSYPSMSDSWLSRGEAQMERHWPKFWWLLCCDLPFDVVSVLSTDVLVLYLIWQLISWWLKVLRHWLKLSFVAGFLPWLKDQTQSMLVLTVCTWPKASTIVDYYIANIEKRRLSKETKPITPSIPKMPLEWNKSSSICRRIQSPCLQGPSKHLEYNSLVFYLACMVCRACLIPTISKLMKHRRPRQHPW